ncbi:MAG: alkaline phosphatase family protein [Candidatus Helarchaeota archaeon]
MINNRIDRLNFKNLYYFLRKDQMNTLKNYINILTMLKKSFITWAFITLVFSYNDELILFKKLISENFPDLKLIILENSKKIDIIQLKKKLKEDICCILITEFNLNLFNNDIWFKNFIEYSKNLQIFLGPLENFEINNFLDFFIKNTLESNLESQNKLKIYNRCLIHLLNTSYLTYNEKNPIRIINRINFFARIINYCPKIEKNCSTCLQKQNDIINLYQHSYKNSLKLPIAYFLLDDIEKFLTIKKQCTKFYWTKEEIFSWMKTELFSENSDTYILHLIQILKDLNILNQFNLSTPEKKNFECLMLTFEKNLTRVFSELQILKFQISKILSDTSTINYSTRNVLSIIANIKNDKHYKKYTFLKNINDDQINDLINLFDNVKCDDIIDRICFYYSFNHLLKLKKLSSLNRINQIYSNLVEKYPERKKSIRFLINYFDNHQLSDDLIILLKNILLCKLKDQLIEPFGHHIKYLMIQYLTNLDPTQNIKNFILNTEQLNYLIIEFSDLIDYNDDFIIQMLKNILLKIFNNIKNSSLKMDIHKVFPFIRIIIHLLVNIPPTFNDKKYALLFEISKILHFENFLKDIKKMKQIDDSIKRSHNIKEMLSHYFSAFDITKKYSAEMKEFCEEIQKIYKSYYSKINNFLWKHYLDLEIPRITDLKNEILSLFKKNTTHIFLFIIDALSYLKFYKIIYDYKMNFYINELKKGNIVPMCSIYPTNTGPAMISLITGVYPDTHGIVMQKFQMTEKKVEILYCLPPRNLDSNERLIKRNDLKNNVTTIFEALKIQYPSIHRYFLTHSTNIGIGEILSSGTIIKKVLDIKNLFQDIENHINKMAESNKFGFTLIQIPTMDMIYHKIGSITKPKDENHMIYSNILEPIQDMFNNFKIKFSNLGESFKFIITADHGINAFKKGVNAQVFCCGDYYWIESRNILIWTKDKKFLKEIYEKAKNWEYTKFVLDKDEQIKKKIYFEKRSPDIIIIPKDDIYLLPNKTSHRQKFAHGGFTLHELIIPKIYLW